MGTHPALTLLFPSSPPHPIKPPPAPTASPPAPSPPPPCPRGRAGEGWGGSGGHPTSCPQPVRGRGAADGGGTAVPAGCLPGAALRGAAQLQPGARPPPALRPGQRHRLARHRVHHLRPLRGHPPGEDAPHGAVTPPSGSELGFWGWERGGRAPPSGSFAGEAAGGQLLPGDAGQGGEEQQGAGAAASRSRKGRPLLLTPRQKVFWGGC